MNCLEEISCLSDLFYYDLSQKRHADLRKGLREYQFLLLAALSAIENLQEKNLEKFDGLVGENACQIRAIRIALIASNNLDDLDHLYKKIAIVLGKVEKLLFDSINSLMKDGCSLKEAFEVNELDVQLTAEQSFVIKSYLLAEMRECDSDPEFIPSLFKMEKSVPSKMQQLFPHISYTFLSRLANKLKKLLAASSVHFVRKTAFNLQDKNLVNMVSQDFSLEHNGWPCLPMFWSYKTLLSLAQNESMPLILHVKFLSEEGHGYRVVDEEFLFFKPCQKTGAYLETDPTERDLNSAACVIQGISYLKERRRLPCKVSWKEAITSHSIIDIILAGAADHRQYPDANVKIAVQDDEFDSYKVMAEKNGFSLNNPTTFFIQHVYASIVAQKMSSCSDANNFKKKNLPLTSNLIFSV